jgi:membrane protease YdiL (CAAX protease family)
MIAASAALAGLLAAYAYFFRGDFGRLSLIAGLPGSVYRRRRYRVRSLKTLLLFGASALLALVVIGRVEALVRMPGEFAPLVGLLGGGSPDVMGSAAVGVAGGSAIGIAWAWWRRRRGRPPAMLGDYASLLPHDRREAGLALVAALSAGVGEELYFRLALPLAVTRLSGSAVVGLVVTTLMFGAAHRYQRWPGVLATMLTSLLFTAVYLWSGALWLAIAAHAVMDINALVLRPWAGGLVRARADD